jgi:hypothetical protein
MKKGEICTYFDGWEREWICVYIGPNEGAGAVQWHWVWVFAVKNSWLVPLECLNPLEDKKCP